jgi:SAM-dependent methyltransferase
VTLLFTKNGYPIYRCNECEIGFHPTRPTPETLAQLYSKTYFSGGGFEGYPDYVGDERVHRRQAAWYLNRLRRLGLSGGDLLDVGCAAGFFVDEAGRGGWRAAGCDISDYAVGHARTVLKLNVVRSHFHDLDVAPASLDVVTLWSVIAHLPDPRAVEAKLHTMLRRGGHVVIETSDRAALAARLLGARWHLCSPPSVLFFHNRSSLQRLFDPSRWRLVSYRPAVKWISVDHALSRLEHRAGSRLLRAILKGVRRTPLGRMDVPYALRDIRIVVFQKR